MKSQKGITLVSVAIYIVLVFIVIGILATVTSNVRNELKKSGEEGTEIAELNKFEMFFLQEVKKQGNKVQEISANGHQIIFASGSMYFFDSNNNTINMRKGENEPIITIADFIERCDFEQFVENGRTIITVRIKPTNVELVTKEYVLTSEENTNLYENEEDYIATTTVNEPEETEEPQEQKNLPAEYVRVEFLQSTGQQYIDTGVYSTDTVKIDLTMQLLNTSADQKFLGAYGENGLCFGTLNNQWRYGGANWNGTSGTTTLDKVNIKLDKYAWYVNDIFIGSAVIAPNSKPIAIFGVYYNGNLLQQNAIKVYLFDIYEDGKKIRQFIPCYRRSDNKPGLYDLINDVFYTNDSGENFILGPEV